MGEGFLSILTRLFGLRNTIRRYVRNVIETSTCVNTKIGVNTTLTVRGITNRRRLAIYTLNTRTLKLTIATILNEARAFFVYGGLGVWLRRSLRLQGRGLGALQMLL